VVVDNCDKKTAASDAVIVNPQLHRERPQLPGKGVSALAANGEVSLGCARQ
jgi:hypothetical protein